MGVFDDRNSGSGVGIDYIRLRSSQGWPQQKGLPHATSYPVLLQNSLLKQSKSSLPPKTQATKVKKTYYTHTVCVCGKPVHHNNQCRHCEMLAKHAAKVPGWICPVCKGPKRDVARICATCRYRKV